MSIPQAKIVESVGRLLVFLEEIRDASAAKVVQVNDVLDGQKRVLTLGLDLFLLSWGVLIGTDLKIGVDCRVITVDRKGAENILVLINTGQAIRRQLPRGEFVVGNSCGLEEVRSGLRGLQVVAVLFINPARCPGRCGREAIGRRLCDCQGLRVEVRDLSGSGRRCEEVERTCHGHLFAGQSSSFRGVSGANGIGDLDLDRVLAGVGFLGIVDIEQLLPTQILELDVRSDLCVVIARGERGVGEQ